ncbi:MAG TPA: SDR family NAD(P)-dependent oxidoreductase [Nocardioidaceae bacterium]|nr:SDR family NAD(P)-dependent oxidoreductase [Nocardioidaceae bacterium]
MRSIEHTTALVTGATDGLGRSVAHDLAGRGATVLVHGRSATRGERIVDELKRATGNGRVRLYLADLANLSQVETLADDVARDHAELHVLVNNAGIGAGLPDGRERQLSVDGYELRFAVNYLAGYLLTERLLPLLRQSAPARVGNVASLGQQAIDFADVMLTRDYDGWRAYQQSKLAQVIYTVDLSERVPAGEVAVNSLHPGTFMPTKIVTSELDHTVDTLETGTRNVVRLAVDPIPDGVNGAFFDRDTEAKADPQAYDATAQQRGDPKRLLGRRIPGQPDHGAARQVPDRRTPVAHPGGRPVTRRRRSARPGDLRLRVRRRRRGVERGLPGRRPPPRRLRLRVIGARPRSTTP